MGRTPPVQYIECLETDDPTTQRLGFGGDESHLTFRLFLSDSLDADCNEVRRRRSLLNVVVAATIRCSQWSVQWSVKLRKHVI